MTRFLVGLVGLVVALVSTLTFAQSPASIQGVWSVSETTGGVGAATPTSVNAKPQPGFYIFTPRHYSITRVTGDKPRMVPKDPNNITMAELQDANRFVAQTGSYEVKGEAITLRPTVARSPTTMNAAAPVSGTIKLDGKTLTITTKGVATGAVQVVKLTRVE